MNIERQSVVRPFLRWVGGKQRLLSNLIECLPPRECIRHYYEPFLGAGSLFLSEGFPRATLSDRNGHLINAFIRVRDHPEEVHQLLMKHAANLEVDHKEYYYHARALFNQGPEDSLEQGARFIFLNHSNYNGMFRTNQKGLYNVPFGQKKPSMPALEHLRAVSRRLRHSHILRSDFAQILEHAEAGDFVYLDPPIPTLSHTAHFNEYTSNGQSEAQLRGLATIAHELNDRGVYVMISVTKIELIEALYSGWKLYSTEMKRNIHGRRAAAIMPELIITNYQPDGMLDVK